MREIFHCRRPVQLNGVGNISPHTLARNFVCDINTEIDTRESSIDWLIERRILCLP